MKKLFTILFLFSYSFCQAIDYYWVGGTATWNATAGLKWSLTSGGLGGVGPPTATDNAFLDANSGAVTVTTSTAVCLNLDCTGFTGTLTFTGALAVSGNLVLAAGMTVTGTAAMTFNSTTTQTITSNTKAVTCAIIFNGAAGTWTLQDAFSTTGTITLTQGSFVTNNQTVASSSYGGGTTGVRSLTLGTTVWTTSGNWTQTTVTNLTHSAASSTIIFTGATAAFSLNSGNGLTYGNVYVTGMTSGNFAVTYLVTAGDMNFTGSSGGVFYASGGSGVTTVGGSLILASGMTTSAASTGTLTITSATTDTIDTKGITINRPITIAGAGSYTMLSTLTYVIGSGLTGLSITASFDANGNNITGTRFSASAGAGETIDLSGCTLAINTSTYTSNTVIFLASTSGGGVFTAPFSVQITNNSASSNYTFSGGSLTYNQVWYAGSSTGNFIVAGSNTFSDYKDNGSAAHSILFTAGTTQTVGAFNVSGTAGNLITINSNNTSTHALVKSGGGTVCSDYLNIQHSVATPASTWYAGVNSTDNQAVATAGSGWTFTACPSVVTNSGFFKMF